MNTTCFYGFLFYSRISLLTTMLIIMLVWSIPAFCGEIHDAARLGDLAKVKSLLKDNPSLVSSTDNYSDYCYTPLHWAANEGHKDVAELLLTNKAEVNAKSCNGYTPLHFAAAHGYNTLIELLLAKGANVNAKNKFGETPLHAAASRGHKDAAEILLCQKADVNFKDALGNTPLHLAAANKDVAELLLTKGAKINAKNNKGETPLDKAVLGPKDGAEFLKQHGGINGVGPYVVGNDVKAPVLIVDPQPPYTEEARKARVEGIVIFSVIIRKDGTMDTFRVVKGLGYGLDNSAINTISSKWRFKPGTLNGNPVDVITNIEVNFRRF
jgi:TonB family protein